MPPTAVEREDTSPPTPRRAAKEIDTDRLEAAVAEVTNAADRVERAARHIEQVAQNGRMKMNRRDKAKVAGAALGLVTVGVVSTLVVQKIRRGRANRRASAQPSLIVNNM